MRLLGTGSMSEEFLGPRHSVLNWSPSHPVLKAHPSGTTALGTQVPKAGNQEPCWT